MNRPDAERWREIDGLFAELLEVPETDRDAWLESRVDDPETRRELSALLEAAAFTGFMGVRAGEQVSRALSSALDESAGSRSGSVLGPYRLGDLIGRGGMADVYRAERADGTFQQTVAIKVQRRGTDTDDVLARFRAERQILSGLDHPNIARLIDGGATEDGLPYLVMEYVEGEPITDYCERHGLSIRDRLDLFMQVARAVQKAHSMLVVHRDIKPSNVLVTVDGDVKLLDFGIAKLLDPSTLPGATPLTRTGVRPLTPQFASPEQVRGDRITTASDIYQLGLLLHLLLTGGMPFDDVPGPGRLLEDAITGTQPSRPSEFVDTHPGVRPKRPEGGGLARLLRGDLDTIVLAALRKEPERRYPSAHEMAEDVHRHLKGRPISARQDSRVYRLRKFLQRNPLVAPAATAAAVVLILYVVTLDRHGREMEAQRNAARLEAEKAEATRDFLVGLFQSADPFAPVAAGRRDVRVSEVMDDGARRARIELVDRPELQVLMLGTIGDVFLGLGEPERAAGLRREAFELAEAALGPESPQAVEAAVALVNPTILADRDTQAWSDSGVAVAMRALALARKSTGVDGLPALRAEVALARAILFSRSGHASLVPILRHAIVGLRAGDAGAAELADALLLLARTLSGEGNEVEAEPLAREAVALLAGSMGEHHPRTLAASVWHTAMMPDTAEALPRLALLGATLDSVLGPQHEQSIRALSARAILERRMERFAESARSFGDLAIRREMQAGRESLWFEIALSGHAKMSILGGIPEQAIAAYDDLIALNEVDAPIYRLDRAWALAEAGRVPEAMQDLREATSGLTGDAWLARADCVRGRARRKAGDEGGASAAFERAGRLFGERPPRTPEDPCYGVLPDA